MISRRTPALDSMALGEPKARQVLGNGCFSICRPRLPAVPAAPASVGQSSLRSPWPSHRSLPELSMQGQQATLLPALFRAGKMVFSLERNPVSFLRSQHACNRFPSREALLHCIGNWSGTDSFWPQCLLGYDFGLLLISPTSPGQHNCSRKTLHNRACLGFCA